MNETCTIILLPSANWYQEDTSRFIDVVLHTVELFVCAAQANSVRILHFITQMHGSSTAMKSETNKKKMLCKKLAKRENVYNIVFIYCLVSFRFRRRQFPQFAHRECVRLCVRCVRALANMMRARMARCTCYSGCEAKFGVCFFSLHFEISLLLYSFYFGSRT